MIAANGYEGSTMNIDFGVEIRNHEREFIALEPTIEGWGKAVAKYCARSDGKDAPYYYNERANISLLAMGAWNAGAIALEEYPAKKKSKHEDPESNHAMGRCDLAIRLKGKQEFQIEAKHVWMRGHYNDKTIGSRIKSGFVSAFKDANRDTEATARLGCVFFPVSFQTTAFPKYSESARALIATEILRYTRHEAHVWAWCFPKQVRMLKEKEGKGDTRFWPGLIMGMKVGNHFRL
jgi:hypothetical protein